MNFVKLTGITDLNNFEMLEGDLQNKALKMVQEWAEINQKEIIKIWNIQEFKNYHH